MRNTEIHDSERLRIIKDDCVIYKSEEVCKRCVYEIDGIRHDGIRLESNPDKILHESHRIIYIPRIKGELRPNFAMYAELDNESGEWIVRDNSNKTVGRFAEVATMTKLLKLRLKRITE